LQFHSGPDKKYGLVNGLPCLRRYLITNAKVGIADVPIAMATLVDHDAEKKTSYVDDNIVIEKLDDSSVNFKEGDEALRLIGFERSAQFSEEYNRKLRRKLVRIRSLRPLRNGLCRKFKGLYDSTIERGSVLYTVLVR
jgi:hypothetical protein